MADNTTLDPGTGGDTIRDKDRAGVKTPIVALDLNPAGAETLMSGAMPVTDNSGSLTVDDGGGSLTVDGTVGVSGTVTVDSELTTADLDTGAGTDTRAVVGLVIAKSGGAANISNTDPLPVSDAGGSITVDGTVTANAGSGPFPVSDNSGSLTVDAPVATPVFVRLSDGAAAISALPVTDNAGSLTVDGTVSITANSSVNVAQVAGTTTDTNSGVKSAGTQRVVLATDQPQLTNALKVDGSAVTQPVSGTVTANLAPTTSGGLSTSVTISAASTNATSVKASAGQLYGIYCTNVNAAIRYLKIYNKASAPTVGTDTPVLVFGIPGNTAGAGFAIEFSNGLAFGTGIAFALTTGVANSDTGAVAANEQVVNLLYK